MSETESSDTAIPARSKHPNRSAGRPANRWYQALTDEVRSRPLAYAVFACFLVAGPILITLIFPEAPVAVRLVGGVCFGAYAAFSAVLQKFL